MNSVLPDPKLARKVWLFVAMLCGTCILFGINYPILGALTLLASLIVLIPLARENQAHVRKYLPVEVTYSNDRYHYAVYSGPFKEFLISQGFDQKLVVKNPTEHTFGRGVG